MNAFIFHKLFRVSNASNKQFNSGEIFKFTFGDSGRLHFISGYLPDLVRLPIITAVCIYTIYGSLG